MANESQSSDHLDPLYAHSGLSMFPQTFRDFTDFPKLNDDDDDDDDDDIDPIHNYMKAMGGIQELKHPEKLLEQEKVILGAGSELPNSNFATLAASENKDEPVAANTKENFQERRPALGCKRARFSLRPSLIQPSVSLEPILDIAQLQDPEEYFLACERLEIAKKELKRLRSGIVTDLDENNHSTTARRRRPGILGKSVRYKHHQYSSVIFENENTVVPSQETLAQEILNPDGYGSQPEATGKIVESQESELAGSIAKNEKRVNELLDELISKTCENLEGDGALSFLQERLQIKPIAVDKLCLPDLHDMGRTDFIPLGEKLSKPRNALSYMHNLVKGASSRTPAKHKQEAESPVDPLASPTPPKSPFASISLLKKRILQSSLSRDPFSALNADLSPARNHSPILSADEESDQVDSTKELNVYERLKSLVIERDNITAASMGEPEVVTGDSIHLFDKPMKDNNVRSSGADDDLEFRSGSNRIDENLTDENVIRPNTDNFVGRNGSHENREHILVEDKLQQAVPSSQPETNIDDSTMPCTDFETHRHNEIEENVEDMPQETVSSVLPDMDIEDLIVENLNNNPRQLDQSSHAAVKHHAMEDPSKTPDIASEQHIEKTQEPSRISLHERNKVKRPSRGRKRKAVSRRRSVAEAGTFWESGVRRSSRIKTRPLEYWKGERFLYGRVHESLATVIGVKYVSQAKGEGKPTLKVKSYVSDEYKELVEFAALH